MQSCPLVLCVEWPWASPIHIKAISLSAFLLSAVISCKGGQRNVFKQPRTLKFHPQNRSARFVLSSPLSFLTAWKLITEAELLSVCWSFISSKGHINFWDVCECANTHRPFLLESPSNSVMISTFFFKSLNVSLRYGLNSKWLTIYASAFSCHWILSLLMPVPSPG